MPKYKETNSRQGKFVSIYFEDQILPGTFEHTLCQLIDSDLDLAIFDQRYKNDETGAPAYDPRILLKIILFAYSRGITSSRRIARCCEENVIFMALSNDTRPHFTTIADFVASMDKEIIPFFRNVLMICDKMGLIGREMFAIDGCKMPSNSSKQWSGTKANLDKKAAKMERAIKHILEKHRSQDNSGDEELSRDQQYVETLQEEVAKLRKWLDKHDDKMGKRGKPVKSNITDNESANMKTSHGVIQGYNGVTTVDSKHQVIVHAEAFGQGSEQDLLEPMIKGSRENFRAIGQEEDVFNKTKLTADSGFHNEVNMQMLFTEEIDAYVADNQFRKRDPRFADYDRYKERHRKERGRIRGRQDLFTTKHFIFPEDLSHCICPAGKRLYRNGGHVINKQGQLAVRFRAPKSACAGCVLRTQCLRHPDRTEARQVAYFQGRAPEAKERFSDKMKHKIDSAVGRAIYSMRLAIAEPPFAHIRHIMGLNRFSHRGRRKVNTQWNLFCLLHNMKKIHRYAT